MTQKGESFWQTDFISDYLRFTRSDSFNYITMFLRLLKNYELRFLYFGRKYQNAKNKISKKFYKIISNHYRKRYGLEITFNKVGYGLKLIHPWGITVNANAVIGNNVTIFKGVTIGQVHEGKRPGNPTIGDNVTICANATVCGNVLVGNNSMIAAGAFVNFDVPDNSIVIGNPGQIHKKKEHTKEY